MTINFSSNSNKALLFSIFSFYVWITALSWKTIIHAQATTPSSSSLPLLLRIREQNGSIRRVLLSSSPGSTTISGLLLPHESKCCIIKANTNGEEEVLDLTKTLDELDLARNGTLLTLRDDLTSKSTSKSLSSTSKKLKSKSVKSASRFDPYPELAKQTSYSRAKALLDAKGSARRSTSFADLEKLQDTMHKIEPQAKKNAIKRLYMDHDAAERFQRSCFAKQKQKTSSTKKKQDSSMTIQNKVGLLLGTVHKERVQQDRRVRTSLSSTTESAKMCTAVKVHAIWDPDSEQNQKSKKDKSDNGSYYNAKLLHKCATSRAIQIATQLGLQPVGWIFTYNDENNKEDNQPSAREEAQVPILSRDVWNAAKIQTHLMESKQLGRENGSKFVTLAMDASVGATEGFQLCDVVVQMVAEGKLEDDDNDKDGQQKEKRYFHSRDPVIVDGVETNEVDSVLCLVNTAMLSHQGLYSAKDNVLGKNGALTGKVRKRILSALEAERSEKLFQVLSDFHILCGLDKVLEEKDINEIIRLVNKFTRGQKKGTSLGSGLKRTLQNVLSD